MSRDINRIILWTFEILEKMIIRENRERLFIVGRLINCIVNSFGNESTDKMDVTPLLVSFFSFLSNLLPHKLCSQFSSRLTELRS